MPVWARLFLFGSLCAASVADTNGAGSQAAFEEDRLAARALALENERLRTEVARVEQQQRELTVSLAEALAELDLARSREERVLAPVPRRVEAGVRVAEAQVLDVNPRLHMAVLDAGRSAGVEPGVVFAVVRDSRVVARLRVVDVRERIAGAVLEEGGSATPQRGDRAVLAR